MKHQHYCLGLSNATSTILSPLTKSWLTWRLLYITPFVVTRPSIEGVKLTPLTLFIESRCRLRCASSRHCWRKASEIPGESHFSASSTGVPICGSDSPISDFVSPYFCCRSLGPFVAGESRRRDGGSFLFCSVPFVADKESIKNNYWRKLMT